MANERTDQEAQGSEPPGYVTALRAEYERVADNELRTMMDDHGANAFGRMFREILRALPDDDLRLASQDSVRLYVRAVVDAMPPGGREFYAGASDDEIKTAAAAAVANFATGPAKRRA